MRYLVTGGAGFIGSNFVISALSHINDVEVEVLDLLTYAGNLANLKSVSSDKRYSFVNGSINDKGLVAKLMEDCDVVINFAAESHVDYSVSNPKLFFETNVLGTLNLLETARKKDCRFVQISTDEVYGDILRGVSKETDLLVPSSPYSSSKAAADLLVGSYARTYSLDTVITRTTNNYGRYQHIEKLVPKFILMAIMDKKLTIYGKGDSEREWIHVNDNCDAILKVIEKGKRGQIYNIGSGEHKSVSEVAKKILSILGKPQSMLEYVAARPGEDKRYALDISKISELGWKPKIKFEEGLSETIKWYVDNSEWWKGKVSNYDFSKRYSA